MDIVKNLMLIYTHKYTFNTLTELLQYLLGNLFIQLDRVKIVISINTLVDLLQYSFENQFIYLDRAKIVFSNKISSVCIYLHIQTKMLSSNWFIMFI